MKNKTVMTCILVLIFSVCLKIAPAYAFDFPIFEEDFEGTSPSWSAENGVWQMGAPTSGPGAAHGGTKCAATILAGNYPADTDSRLIGPYRFPWDQGVELPEVTGNEELHLRFWNWFNYSHYDSGQVQVSVKDPATGTWGSWVNVGNVLWLYSGVWARQDVDLTGFAGQTIRIGFLHVAASCCEAQGWYIDDIQIIRKVPTFTGDFEAGQVDWAADSGVWQIGTPTGGPGGCYGGSQCAGTALNGTYPSDTDSRLVSAAIDLTGCSATVVYLRFWEWFSYSSYDYGEVQVSVLEPGTGQWSEWESTSISSGVSTGWTLKYVDLSKYSGQIFRIGFLHVAASCCESWGWYIDNIELFGPTPIMPTIDTVFYSPYIPTCTSLIDIFASDSCGGDMSYIWQIPDGGTLEGAGANMEFIPPAVRTDPYRVRVAACSTATHLCTSTKLLKVFTEALYDLDGDDDIDGADLAAFITGGPVNATTTARFAEEFGMTACKQNK